MRSTLKSLKDYQDVLIRIDELDCLLAHIPPDIENLEKEWRSIQERIKELKKKQEELENQLKVQQVLLEETTVQAQKFEKDLHEVTNNKEYHAVLKEIDVAKKKLHSLGESITNRGKDMEGIQRNLEECHQLEKESKAKYKEAYASHQESQSEHQAEREKKRKLKKGLVGKFSPSILKRFERISSRRNGVGLALCIASVCQSCNVRVRQSVVDQLRKHETIMCCESCKRILFFAESEES